MLNSVVLWEELLVWELGSGRWVCPLLLASEAVGDSEKEGMERGTATFPFHSRLGPASPAGSCFFPVYRVMMYFYHPELGIQFVSTFCKKSLFKYI